MIENDQLKIKLTQDFEREVRGDGSRQERIKRPCNRQL